MGMSDVYRRFLNDELSLEEAADLLQAHAAAGDTQAGLIELIERMAELEP